MSTPTKPNTKVNTSSLPPSSALAASAGTTNSSGKPLASSTHTALTNALLSTSGIARIESQLSQDLAASGWTSNLRLYVTQLVRSGECATYQDCMRKVMSAMAEGSATSNGTNGKDSGATSAPGKAKVGLDPIPSEVLKDGLKVVRREVERVAEIRVDDVDD